MKTVFIAGATGYLGQHLVKEYVRRGWFVRALVRDKVRAGLLDLPAQMLVEAEATKPETLAGQLDGADLVISSLGITRQKDGLSYQDVDYQANLNLLEEALKAGVPRFAYIHVLNADRMKKVPLVTAKQAFVERLQQAPMASTVIAPSGYFSDMRDFYKMACSGRVWLFGDGSYRINPVHGADLAVATADAIDEECQWLDVGGPEVFTQTELAILAFQIAQKPLKISYLPDSLRRMALVTLPFLTPRSMHGPAQFFLTALGMDVLGEQRGTHQLSDYFASIRP
ncbi:MAG: Putative NADH-flavin reductase [uncultured Thiotrichaceae bacterium]|uniref:NADH-flavin reductase n=1 Tax=uncultured Thiotrichaceae bacterium TaxID=298394 RepID=A0A6S6TKL6_9GAMM|nr:MAG: Putative NADH-flavin reductase [uncultured Thiotrichaceae bacterium]